MVQREKIQVVEETSDRLNRSRSMVVVQYKGLTVAQMQDLRAKLRENGAEMKVVKNRLAKRALADAESESLDDILSGPTAMVFAYDDASAGPKVCTKFADDNDKLVICGGLLEKQRIDGDMIKKLAKMPGREELLTQ
ncbi:MAG: 50S ribosomal protein L10, partial [Candidatus Sumerlaeota bacterium]